MQKPRGARVRREKAPFVSSPSKSPGVGDYFIQPTMIGLSMFSWRVRLVRERRE